MDSVNWFKNQTERDAYMHASTTLPPPHTHTQPQQHGGMISTMFLCTEGKQAKN